MTSKTPLIPTVVFLLMFNHIAASAAEPPSEQPTLTVKDGEVVEIAIGKVQPGSYGQGVYLTADAVAYSVFQFDVARDDQGNRVIGTLGVSEQRKYYRPNSTLISRIRSIGISYPRKTFKEGDLIPLRGAVCRITGLSAGGDGGRIVCKILPASDLPDGVSFPHEKHAIPLGGSAGVWEGSTIRLKEVSAAGPAEDTGPEKVTLGATIEVEYEVQFGLRGFQRRTLPPKQFKEGDVIDVPIRGMTTEGDKSLKYVIRGIVPPNEKQRVCGWILIEPVQ